MVQVSHLLRVRRWIKLSGILSFMKINGVRRLKINKEEEKRRGIPGAPTKVKTFSSQRKKQKKKHPYSNITYRRHIIPARRQLADLEPHQQVVLGVQVRRAAGRCHACRAPLGAPHRRRDRQRRRQHPARWSPAHWTVLFSILLPWSCRLVTKG